MKNFIFLLIIHFLSYNQLFSQNKILGDQEIHALIDQYSQARDTNDTVLLAEILTADVDQLVSSGEWRVGLREAKAGMMRSSTANSGERRLLVEKIRYLDDLSAIVDARYEIESTHGETRKMWSTFIVVYRDDSWKISGIRNMMPTGSN